MLAHADSLSLLTEVSIALAGFTGVAATFGGRDRAYSVADQTRIEAIFYLTGSVLAGCLLALTLDAAGIHTSSTLVAASALSLVITVRPLHIAFTRAFTYARDPEVSTSMFVAIVSATIISTSALLHVWNIVAGQSVWPLMAASSLQLGWGLFLFARILTQRN